MITAHMRMKMVSSPFPVLQYARDFEMLSTMPRGATSNT